MEGKISQSSNAMAEHMINLYTTVIKVSFRALSFYFWDFKFRPLALVAFLW